MLFPSDIESKIGFDKIKDLLDEFCLCDLGKEYVQKISFSNDYHLTNKLLQQTEEFTKLLQQKISFPNSNYIDIRDYLNKAIVVNSWLTSEEIFEISLFLKTIEDSVRILTKMEEDLPALSKLTCLLSIDTSIQHEIGLKIDNKGEIRSNASEELKTIRNQIQKEELKVRRVVDKVLQYTRKNGFTPEDTATTIRSGRLVIPVRSEYKRQVKGFIHDESASGQTCFIEPAEALEINNEIRDLEYSEKREIIRILTELTDLIRPEIPNLDKATQYLGMLDFIRSKAKLAILVEGIKPEIHKQPIIEWSKAKHPLLMLSLKEAGKEIVPLDIELHSENKILIISGPNAGGKSVCLKTVGLLQYMMQCGLLVPMSEGSRMGIYNQIFIDIGDEQSIENDLSTYSSHLLNMKYFMTNANKSTLFLIDEFGTGTEPQFGAAIAESVLIELRRKRAWGVLTTHYANLKKYGENTPGIMNGAMRFDMNNLEPSFNLDIGRPGSSFAIEIAQKIGLPEDVLKNAKGRAGYDQVKFDKLINQLEQEKSDLKKQIKINVEKEDKLKKSVDEYETLKSYLQEKEKDILEDARIKAENLFKEANRKIENTIRIIKEEQAEKLKTQKARKDLELHKQKLARKKPPSKTRITAEPGKIKKGDWAKIKDSDSYGIIREISGKEATLEIGNIRSRVKISMLERIKKPEGLKRTGISKNTNKDIMRSKMASFNPVLNLRGKRAEEVQPILEMFIDDALMLGYHEVKILHGKGDGILREVVREQLRSYPQLISATDEHIDRGGAGITVVHLK
jgi:DNA mismatch repair protein MutS2